MTLRGLFTVLVCLLLIGSASAVQRTFPDISSYSYTADPGSVIYKIVINDIPFGTNQTHTLYYNGQPMLLTIDTYSSWFGAVKEADISLTLLNGSTQTAHTSATTIVSKYKTTIQPVVRADSSTLTGGTVAFLTVDLMIGMNPVGVQFSTQPINFNPSNALPFQSASGNLGSQTTVYIYQVTEAEFHNTIEIYNPAAGLGDLGSTIFQWTWDTVLGFIGMIPVIGPMMVSLISIMGNVIGEGYFWLVFIIQNFPAILCGVESLILMFAVINAGTGKNSMGKMAKNFYSYNVSFIHGLIFLVETVKNWTVSIINMISNIVSALKPI